MSRDSFRGYVRRPARSIFVSNNGILDGIGRSQVLPYLDGLANLGHQVRALTVESHRALASTSAISDIESQGIELAAITRRNGVWGAIDRFLVPCRLRRRLARLVAQERPDLIHCRSYMPLSSALRVSKRESLPLLFDTRGFWIDQRVESGIWNPARPLTRAIIRYFRKLESMGLEQSAAIVVLTEDAKEVVESHAAYRGAPVSVIPCCVDQAHFTFDPEARARRRAELNVSEDEPVVTWLGSASEVYRIDLVYRFFDAVRSGAGKGRLLFVGNHDAASHATRAARFGIQLHPSEVTCVRVPHADVPQLLSASDVGLSFVIRTGSSLGVSATKLGEYLACGLPVVSNTGIGDINQILSEGMNGAVLRDDSSSEILRCAALVGSIATSRDEIKSSSRDRFSLTRAIRAYDGIYRSFNEAL